MTASTVGVILLQLGTPDEPTAPALRRYLREFLGDPRVIDLPRAIWRPLLEFAVLPRRPRRSAALYRSIWRPDGSPLLITSNAQSRGVERLLRARGMSVRVAVGMRYGQPSIASAVEALIAAGAERLIALPMYPQYAGATTGSSLEALYRVLGGRRVVPPVQVVPPYFGDERYLAVLAAVTRERLERLPEEPDHLLVSFHGLPERYVTAGDPYRTHCEATAAGLARVLGWPAARLTVVYQSRFGREPWLRPYADETIRALPERGIRRVAVVCPGFTVDCLETIEEMGMTNRDAFLTAGGEAYALVPCVNDDPRWIATMADFVAGG